MGKRKMNNKVKRVIYISLSLIVSFIMIVIINVNQNTSTITEIAKTEAERLDEQEKLKGTVKVLYIDEEGNSLSEETILEGIVGEEYETQRKEISGYKTNGEEPFNKTGTYTETEKIVTYTYTKLEKDVDVSAEDNIVTVQIGNEKIASQYKMEIWTKIEEENISGAEIQVNKEDKELIKEKTLNGFLRAGTITVDEEGIDTYIIKETKKAKGYKAVDEQIEVKIKKVWNNDENRYEIDISDNENIDIELTDDNVIKITMNHIKNEDVFDLELEKYIEKIEIINSKGTKEQEVNTTDKDNILKIEIPAKELEKTQIKVVYVLKVTNKGDIPGYAKQIADDLPEGFEYIGGGAWEVNNNTAITKELADTIINPGESKEVRIELKWNIANGSVGQRKNIASIIEYYNEDEIEDKTPDNTDDAELIVSIKTGGDTLYILVVLGTLIIIAVILKLTQEKNK